MLTRDEAGHLSRTLPKWAPIIDYWIIGIDRYNTDNSEEVIMRELGHIPGEIVVVDFDGMGPTWTKLVERGLQLFPQATHGVLADADFMPIVKSLDKMQLDVRCGKHMFTVWSGSQERTARKMDWIYRNIPGTKVERRTHQILTVPDFPGRIEQTIIDLEIEEQPGGFQDRSGKKSERYISWLMKDLEEFPDDPRTLYYLGHGHWEIFLDHHQNPSQEDWDHLHKAVKWFEKRVAVGGNFEERWFAMLKLGEMHDRFLNKWDTALKWYKQARDDDPARADTYFYIGQHYRLHHQYMEAIDWLEQAADLDIPPRSLFQWHDMYLCLSKLELGRAAVGAGNSLSTARLQKIYSLLQKGQCETPSTKQELRGLVQWALEKINSAKDGTLSKPEQMKRLAQRTLNAIAPHMQLLERKLFRKQFKLLQQRLEELTALSQHPQPTCKLYRQATKHYLGWFKQNEAKLKVLVSGEQFEQWLNENTVLRAMCR